MFPKQEEIDWESRKVDMFYLEAKLKQSSGCRPGTLEGIPSAHWMSPVERALSTYTPDSPQFEALLSAQDNSLGCILS